jgi:hypothetical protein
LLQSCLSPQSLLFSARGSDGTKPFNGWSKAKAQLDKKISQLLAENRDGSGVTANRQEEAEPWTLHDLRRTYCTNLQRLGVRLEVIESLVNHVSGSRSGVAGIYQRHRWEKEMREAVFLYEKWIQCDIIQLLRPQ